MFFFSNQSSSGESEKLSTQLEYSVYVLHHGKFYIHVLGQLNGQGHYVVFLGKSSLRAVSCMYFQM